MNLSNCELIDCNGLVPDLYTTVLLTPAIAPLIGGVSVVRLAEYPTTCFRVVKPSNPIATPLAYTITNTFQASNQTGNCTDCAQSIQLYILEDCLGVQPPIYSFSEELANVIEKVINIVEHTGVCWSVSSVVYDDQDTEIVTIATNDHGVPQIFTDCECCLPTPPPTPVKYTRVIPKPDRQFYQITQSQCDIDGNIKFAEGYYRLFKKLKYGIDSACDNINLEKLWIKKNLSDLAVINDPTACTITTPVTPVICPEPEGHPYIPPVTLYTFHVNDGGAGTNFSCGGTCLDGSSEPIQQACPAFNFTLSYNILPSIDPMDTYVFTYNGGCVLVYGAWIAAGANETYNYTYALESNNIIAGNYSSEPCTLCPS